jgi:hypothetical protein
MWFCFILMYGRGGYTSYPVLPPNGLSFASEAECREAGMKTGYPEMPGANTPPESWPNQGWSCKAHQ